MFEQTPIHTVESLKNSTDPLVIKSVAHIHKSYGDEGLAAVARLMNLIVPEN